MSMSSSMCRYMREFVASLMEGTGLQPKTEPRPVVKHDDVAPPATRPVIETGSWPGVSMKTKPRVVIGSPYWKTSIIGVVPALGDAAEGLLEHGREPAGLVAGRRVVVHRARCTRQYHSHHL